VIPLLSRAAVRDLDRDAVLRFGLPSLLLMENAGRGAFDVLLEVAASRLARVLIVGGTGQNGGDGWVVARHLAAAGFAPSVALVGAAERITGDALVNWLALERMRVARLPGLDGGDLSPLTAALGGASLVVDALFGTGLDRPLSGVHADVVALINACPASVLALDLPSGVDADTGAVLGTAVRADWTVTFAAHKRGLEQFPAAGLCGRVRRVSIGVPAPVEAPAGRIEPSDFSALLRSRRADAHKGQAGHVLLVAGAPGHTGAAVLAGLGALRCGAGLCTIAPRGDARTSIEAKAIELMTAALPAEAVVAAVLELVVGKQAVVVGPGLGLDAEARSLCNELAHLLPVPAVLDADALTAVGQQHAILRDARGPRVLTPHPGEAGRLLGISSARVQADRYAAAEQIARQTGCVTVLKGARSIVADPSGRLRVCPTGTPAMAVGGTGDVLAGAIGALLGQQLPAFDAAIAGVYLHGLAGELAANGDRGLLASELAAALPRAIAQCVAG
jgi:ADP-dependent NAD(P)H-hydrate dehydratase / NAD(P)H-hydrate epimerase